MFLPPGQDCEELPPPPQEAAREEVTWPHPPLVALSPRPTHWAGGWVERLHISSLALPGAPTTAGQSWAFKKGETSTLGAAGAGPPAPSGCQAGKGQSGRGWGGARWSPSLIGLNKPFQLGHHGRLPGRGVSAGAGRPCRGAVGRGGCSGPQPSPGKGVEVAPVRSGGLEGWGWEAAQVARPLAHLARPAAAPRAFLRCEASLAVSGLGLRRGVGGWGQPRLLVCQTGWPVPLPRPSPVCPPQPQPDECSWRRPLPTPHLNPGPDTEQVLGTSLGGTGPLEAARMCYRTRCGSSELSPLPPNVPYRPLRTPGPLPI